MSNEYDEITINEENPILKVLKWTLSIILIVLFIILLIWLVKGAGNNNNNNINPLLDRIFTENINIMKDAAKDYYSVDKVPTKEGQTHKLTLQEMIDLKLLLPLIDKEGNTCDVNKSYTEITKVGKEYQLKVNLSCGDEEDYIIVYLGCYDYCKNYVCEVTDKEEKEEEIEKVSNPSCTLRVTKGTLLSGNKYTSNITIGFKSKKASTGATITDYGVGLKKNYEDSVYTVKELGKTKVYGYIKDSNGKTATCNIVVEKVEQPKVTVGDPSCSLKVVSGTLNDNGTYGSDVVIGFDKVDAGKNATLTGSGVGLKTNYEAKTYTVKEEGTTMVYGYVKNSEGKTASCNITVTKEIEEPMCTLKVQEGTKGTNGTYKSDVVIGFDKTDAGNGSTLTGAGIGLTTNYTDKTYTITKNGTHTIYGYVKNSNGKTAVCSIKVTKDTKYRYLYEKEIETEYSDWSDWSENKIYTEDDKITWGKQELVWNQKNGAKKITTTKYQTNKNNPIWHVDYVKIGSYKDYVCDGYTYFRDVTTSTTYQASDYTYSHTLYNVSSIPNDTPTTRYEFVDINYAVCKETCTSKPVFIVDVYERAATEKTESEGELSAKCKVVVKDIPVYGSKSTLVGYAKNKIVTVTYEYYYHTKTRTIIKEAYTAQVWSDSDNDKTLIEQGYKYTGIKEEK